MGLEDPATEMWAKIERIKSWAKTQIDLRTYWGRIEWYPYSNDVNVRFERDPIGAYHAIAYFSEGDLGERLDKCYIILF